MKEDQKDFSDSTTEVKKQSADTAKKPNRSPDEIHHSPVGRVFALVFLCFIASFLGAWVFIGSGIIPLSQPISSEQRQAIVMQEGEVVAEVAERVSPSVVSILTTGGAQDMFGRETLNEGAGTGVIVSSDGYIMTNKHVIGEGTQQVEVVLADGERINDVKIVGSDPLNDIAFLKIEGKSDLPAAKFGDSNEIKIGQKVIAIGNTLGQYQNSVTSGIISGIGRPIVAAADASTMETERFEDLFQTDAAINPGNSGGPLVSLEGEVIGINTAIIEDAQGIGFSIPINVVKGLIKGVIEDGKVSRAYLGVRYVSLTPEVATQLNITETRGAYVGTVDGSEGPVPGGPADQAGIQTGDIITKINDVVVGERNGLAALLAQYAPGDTITITYLREGAEHTVEVTLTEYED